MSLCLSHTVRSVRPTPEVLASCAKQMLAEGRFAVARSLVAALQPAGASAALVSELNARVLHAQGSFPEALAVLDTLLTHNPRTLSLRQLRAEVRLDARDNAGAATDAAEVVVAESANFEGRLVLGRALLRLGHTRDALICLREVLNLRPTDISVRFDLLEVCETLGNEDEVDVLIAEGITVSPQHPGLRNLAILRRVRKQDFRGAIDLALAARAAAALDGAGFGLLGHALSCLGEHEAATDAYVEALKLVPGDPYVQHLVAAAGRIAGGEQAPPDYVRVLFNGYADRFDEHLIHLGYRVPGLIRAQLSDAGCSGPVLDLGCGTGLVALAAAAKTEGPWIGVDVSGRMLEEARTKRLYAELHEAELVNYLSSERRQFPLVVAGDVLCYFGGLEPLLAAVADRLTASGQFIFSVERAPDGVAHSLGRMGRFSHSAEHIRAASALANLFVVSIKPEDLRQEGGCPVPGYLCCLEKAAC